MASVPLAPPNSRSASPCGSSSLEGEVEGAGAAGVPLLWTAAGAGSEMSAAPAGLPLLLRLLEGDIAGVGEEREAEEQVGHSPTTATTHSRV